MLNQTAKNQIENKKLITVCSRNVEPEMNSNPQIVIIDNDKRFFCGILSCRKIIWYHLKKRLVFHITILCKLIICSHLIYNF